MTVRATGAIIVNVSPLDKLAKLKTPLQPHQQRLVDRLQQDDQPGLVALHGLGSGKTLGALAAQDALGMDANYVVPASLQDNLTKERTKHIEQPSPSKSTTLQNLALNGPAKPKDMLVVDEAHRARDPGSKTFKALAQTQAKKRLLLTGSPFYNHPHDLAPLIDLAAAREVLPLDKTKFNDRYVRDRQVSPGFIDSLFGATGGSVPELNPRRADELKKIYGKWTDYHKGSREGFPDVTHEDVQVPMSASQLRMYDAVMDKAPPWVKHKVLSDLPPSKSEAQNLNAFLTGTRQIANTTAPFQSNQEGAQAPKIDAAFARLKAHLEQNPHGKAVVYSNFLDAGLNPYKAKLDEAHIPYGEYSGETPQLQRDQMVRDYNAGKLKALLLSSAGGEGLDLHGSSLAQMLEPAWNSERLHQVEGRGARYMSHAGLPEGERKLHVERYLSTRPRSGLLEKLRLKRPGASVDEYLRSRSNEKDDLIKQFKALLPDQQSQQPYTPSQNKNYGPW